MVFFTDLSGDLMCVIIWQLLKMLHFSKKGASGVLWVVDGSGFVKAEHPV